MKKRLLQVALAAILMFLFTSAASAADFSRQADYLNRLQLLRGSAGGYQLSRAPTRLEAAVLVSRLISAGKAAGGGDAHPFIDVPSWADPSVEYLYQKGVVKGSSGRFFKPYAECTADMYLTYLLRALGYSDANGDFNSNTARDFALGIGLLDEAMSNELKDKPFLRGHMAALTFEALSCSPSSGEGGTETLLGRWIEENGQTEPAAEIKGLFEVCASLEAALINTDALTKSEAHSSCTLKLIPGGEYSQKAVVKRSLDGEEPEAFSEITYDSAGETGWSRLYYKNGIAYLENSANEKIKFETEIETIFPKDPDAGRLPFGAGEISAYTETKNGENLNIELTVDGSLYNGAIDFSGENGPDIAEKTVGSLNLIYEIGPDGLLNRQTMSFDFLYASDGGKSYGIYEETRIFPKEKEQTPIVFPSFSGFRDAPAQ